MANINREYNRTISSDKPWDWYYDRLPKRLRKALSGAQHNWSDMQVYRMWKGNKGYKKHSIAEIIKLIEDHEERIAYQWAS